MEFQNNPLNGPHQQNGQQNSRHGHQDAIHQGKYPGIAGQGFQIIPDAVRGYTDQQYALHLVGISGAHRHGHFNKPFFRQLVRGFPLKAADNLLRYHILIFNQTVSILNDAEILINDNDPSVVKTGQLSQLAVDQLRGRILHIIIA